LQNLTSGFAAEATGAGEYAFNNRVLLGPTKLVAFSLLGSATELHFGRGFKANLGPPRANLPK
jgi:hypothetical protein